MLGKEPMETLYRCLTERGIADFADMFADMGTLFTVHNSKKDKYVFIDGGKDSKILAIAHTDYVKYHNPVMSCNGTRLYCGQLDDRLGVWVITYLLKKVLPVDLPFDILLTDQEESCNSTAKGFNYTTHKDKQYNWMFEWDRRGTDVVMYDYKTSRMEKLLKKYKFTVGYGSSSDICYLSQLGCVGMNFGVGYHNEHTDKCHVNLADTMTSVRKFIPFYVDNYSTRFRYNKSKVDKAAKNKGNKGVMGYPTHKYKGQHQPQIGYSGGYKWEDEEWLTDEEAEVLARKWGVTGGDIDSLYGHCGGFETLIAKKDVVEEMERHLKDNVNVHSIPDKKFNQSEHA